MFIDIHAHAYKRPFPRWGDLEPFPTPELLLEHYDRIGIEKAVLMPLIGPEVYLPQGNEEILETCERFPGKFIPFVNVHPRAISNTPDANLSELMLKYKDWGARGLGEIITNMNILDPYMINFFRHAEIAEMPVTIHLATRTQEGGYGLRDEAGLPGLCEILARFPRLKVFAHSHPFWAEIGELKLKYDRSTYPTGKVAVEGTVPKMMRCFKNLYGDLSAGSGYYALARDPEYAAKFLTEFQDRLFFGLDICNTPGTEPRRLVTFLLKIREQGTISEEVFQKVARGNAIKFFDLNNEDSV